MTKDELLYHCHEAIKTEEHATTIYLKHMRSIILRTDLDDWDKEKARDILETLIDGNIQHKSFLQKLIKRIEQENRDVY